MPGKRGIKLPITLYFALLSLLLLLTGVHVFGIYPIQTDFFARYLIGLVFVMMLLPLVPKIKLFDLVDIKRESRMFRTTGKKK